MYYLLTIKTINQKKVMSYTKIWVHVVWGTKNKHPFLVNELRTEFLKHAVENAARKGVEVCLINCWVDHVHCLVRLTADQSIAYVVKLIKGEASRWINQNRLSEKKFSWAREYYAGSVSEGNLRSVRHYILNQERHHSNRTFSEEVADYFKLNPMQAT